MTAPAPSPDRNRPAPPAEAPLPAEAETGSDDGVLDSIGKAISSPVKGAAEPEEPGRDEKKPPVPPG